LGGTDRQITLDVQVTDKSGKPIRGLREQDFTLLDDKRPQKIVSFHAVDVETPATSDPPVEIVLVVDAINASFRALAFERDEVKKFLLQNGGKLALPVSLVIFSEAGTNFGNSSRDGNALAEAFDKYAIGLRSPTRFQDGYNGAIERVDITQSPWRNRGARENATRQKTRYLDRPRVAVALGYSTTYLQRCAADLQLDRDRLHRAQAGPHHSL
jgi:VWFA-related protein